MPAAYCLFETPLGWCGIAWSGGPEPSAPCAVTRLQLPEAARELTESGIRKTCGAATSSLAPPPIAEVIEKISKHLRGEIQDFRKIIVDTGQIPAIARKCYEATREIPAGQTVTYSEIAYAVGRPAAARAVGQALGRNPIPLIIPCHRVRAASGKPGGFSAYGGRVTKAKLLALEGAVVNLCLELDTQTGAATIP